MQDNRNNPLDEVPRPIDERRRRFLGRLLAGGAAVAAIPAMTTIALGGEDDKAGKGRGRRKNKGGQGKSGPSGPRSDPAVLAERLIEKFDKDGDKALNQTELAAAITASHERNRRGQGEGAADQPPAENEGTGRGKRGGKRKGGRG